MMNGRIFPYNANVPHFETASIMTYNLMRDSVHEQFQRYRFQNREQRILKLIKECNPDIIGFQECRDLLPHAPFHLFQSRLSQCGYESSVHFDEVNPRLKVAIAWKRDKFFCIDVRTMWLNRNQPFLPLADTYCGQRQPRPIGVVTLARIGSKGMMKPIQIWTTHFGHSEAEKFSICDFLPKLMKVISSTMPCVLLVDTNFFSQHGGPVQLLSITRIIGNDFKLQDLSITAKPMIQSSTQTVSEIEVGAGSELQKRGTETQGRPGLATGNANVMPHGTFIGTEIDRVKPELGSVGDRLDFIFGAKVYIIENSAYVCNKTGMDPEPPCYMNRDVTPSDHMPVGVTLCW